MASAAALVLVAIAAMVVVTVTVLTRTDVETVPVDAAVTRPTNPTVAAPVASSPQTSLTASTTSVPAELAVPPAGRTPDNPVPVGMAADVGNGWTLAVTGVHHDTSQGPRNREPRTGVHDVMVELHATYTGDADSAATQQLNLDPIDNGILLYGPIVRCETTPNPLRSYTPVPRGVTVVGNECWTLSTTNSHTAELVATTGFDGQPVYFTLNTTRP